MQLAYSINIAAAVAGQLAQLEPHQIESRQVETAAGLGFGLAAVQGTADNQCKLPTAAGQLFLGVSVKTDAVNPSNAGNPGYPYQRSAGLLRKGKIWVTTTGTVAIGDAAFFNVVTGAFGPRGAQTLAGVYAADGGNTGNFTSSAVVVTAATAKEGVYKIEFLTATEFEVFDPDGNLLGIGNTGVAFSQRGVAFTLTAGGTPAVAGDGAIITVSATSADADPVPSGVFRSAVTGAGLAILEVNLPQ